MFDDLTTRVRAATGSEVYGEASRNWAEGAVDKITVWADWQPLTADESFGEGAERLMSRKRVFVEEGSADIRASDRLRYPYNGTPGVDDWEIIGEPQAWSDSDDLDHLEILVQRVIQAAP